LTDSVAQAPDWYQNNSCLRSPHKGRSPEKLKN